MKAKYLHAAIAALLLLVAGDASGAFSDITGRGLWSIFSGGDRRDVPTAILIDSSANELGTSANPLTVQEASAATEQTLDVKFGLNDAVAGSSSEDVWSGSTLYPWSSWPASCDGTPVAVTIESDEAGDTSVPVLVTGLDTDCALQTETISTDGSDGTTPVTLANTYTRLFRARVTDSSDPAGSLAFKVSTTEVAQIEAGENQTTMAVYTVPAGSTAYVSAWQCSCGKSDELVCEVYARRDGQVFAVSDAAYCNGQQAIGSPGDLSVPGSGLTFPEKTDLVIRVENQTGSASAVVASFRYGLVAN